MTATVYTDTGEIDVRAADGHVELTAYSEIPLGHDRVHGRKITLLLAPHDVDRLRRALGTVSRGRPRPRASGPRLALAVRERECIA